MNAKVLFSILLSACFFCSGMYGQSEFKYQVPDDKLVQFVDAPPTPGISISSDGKWILIMEKPGLPSIEEVSQPELRLAGLRINPSTNGSSRGRYMNGLKLQSVGDNKEYVVEGLPENPKISKVDWSPDSKKIAFCITVENGIELWVLDLESGKAARLTEPVLNDFTRGYPFAWMPDSKTLVYKSINKDRITPPEASKVPTGPVIQENTGKKAPVRTYQDLLKSPHDEDVFDYYATSQLVKVDLNGNKGEYGKGGIITRFSVSPDGNYLLVTRVHKPYSYLVPYSRFPQKIEVWDMSGETVYTLADIPLADDIPTGFGSVRKGPRSVEWRSDAPAELFWTEALDEGDGSKEVEFRDQLFSIKAPFDGEPVAGPKCSLRYAYTDWGTGDLAIMYEFWWKTRKAIASRFEPDNPTAPRKVIMELNTEDRYADPGDFINTVNEQGHYVLLFGNKGKSLYLRGRGGSPRGYEPFIDRYDIATGKTTRLWQSKPPYYEYPYRILDLKKGTIIVSRESVTEQPNFHLTDFKRSKSTQLTKFPHPHKELSELGKQLITYKRDDGVQLSATLHLPYKDPEKNKNLPVIMWAYPREFKDARSAGQVDDSPYYFDRISHWSTLVWLTQGYAVFNDPKMPIIGEGDEEPNDSFVKQLVASAKAAVDTVVAMGVADPDKIVIGGHSYGAFMTANLLAHSDLFAAGIARSGAYNRTLTPFGFQAEERTYWEAPEVYYNMSPFMHADKVNEPILLIHGQADNNSGTFPLQSERYYHALKGLGATVRLVMLPAESHGYRARESLLHMLWETERWIKKYVSGEEE